MAICYSITENLSIFKHFLTMFLTVANDMLSFKSNTYAINILYKISAHIKTYSKYYVNLSVLRFYPTSYIKII